MTQTEFHVHRTIDLRYTYSKEKFIDQTKYRFRLYVYLRMYVCMYGKLERLDRIGTIIQRVCHFCCETRTYSCSIPYLIHGRVSDSNLHGLSVNDEISNRGTTRVGIILAFSMGIMSAGERTLYSSCFYLAVGRKCME